MERKNFLNNAQDLVPPKNDTPYKRILAVGDIHGNFDVLMSLWKKISVTADDLVIFLGDYIDRGNQSAEVIQWIMQKSKEKNFIFLCGNHEQMMVGTFTKRYEPEFWLSNGGNSTLRSLKQIEPADILVEIVNFAANLPIYHSMKIGGRDYIFVHAGIEEKFSMDEQDFEYLLWERANFLSKDRGYYGAAMVIVGHTPIQKLFIEKIPDSNENALMLNRGPGIKFLIAHTQEENIKIQPYKIPNRNILMLDTGSYMKDGKISCVDILSGEFWQS